MFGNFVGISCRSVLVIIFSLSFLVILLQVCKLYFLSYTIVLWLEFLEVRNYLTRQRLVFIGKICLEPLKNLVMSVLFARQLKVVLKNMMVCCTPWKILLSNFDMLEWILWNICKFLLKVSIAFLLLLTIVLLSTILTFLLTVSAVCWPF